MNLDDIKKEIEQQLSGLTETKVTLTLEPEYTLEKLEKCEPMQVRDAAHLAPKAVVAQYAVQMQNGASFPPPVITKDGYVLDGNTRIAARKRIKDRTCAVFIANINFDKNQTRDMQNRLEYFGAVANQTGGQRLTTAEALRQAQTIYEMGVAPKKIAEQMAVPKSTIQSAVARSKTEKRVSKLGASLKDTSPSQLTALGRDNVLSMNDEPWRQLVELTVDAGLSSSEISKLAKSMRETSSDDEKIKAVTDMREVRRPQIAQRRMTGTGTPPASITMLKHMNAIMGYSGKEREMIEANPQERVNYVKMVSGVITVLQNVLSEQTAFEMSDAAE